MLYTRYTNTAFFVFQEFFIVFRYIFLVLSPKTGRSHPRTLYFQWFAGMIHIFKAQEFILFTVSKGFTVISAHAGIRLLLTAFLTERIFDQAVQ